MIEEVILVDENDNPIGTMEKIEAHKKGLLHRAFSVFIFNSKNQLLLQRRALNKYHSPGLWTNTCCSHPRPGEEIDAAAKRRLKEEMGIETVLTFKSTFIYKTPFENGLTEHELDYVFTGIYNDDPLINTSETDSFAWLNTDEIKARLKTHSNEFTSWFKIAIEKLF